MEKMTEIEALCETVVLELIEIKMHICNGRDFEGGVGLGGLINSLLYRKDQEEDKRKDEEVQDEDEDEECEESSEEEEFEFEHEYITERVKNKELMEEIEKLKEKKEEFEPTKRAVFELQDLVMRLIRFKKIDSMEWPHVFNILRNTGVEKGDIDVLCKGEIK